MRTISARFRHTPPSGNLEMGNYVFLKCWKKKFVQIYYISKNFHLAFYECYGSLTGYGSTVSTSFWPPGSGSNSQRQCCGSGSTCFWASWIRCAICDDCVFRNAPSQQEGDRGGRWQQQRRSHLSTVKLWYSFSFTVATDHVWIDLCPVPAIEILIFNYQMLSEWKWYYKMSTHRVVCFASV